MNRPMVTEDYQLDWREVVTNAIRLGQKTGQKRKVFFLRSRRCGFVAQSWPIADTGQATRILPTPIDATLAAWNLTRQQWNDSKGQPW